MAETLIVILMKLQLNLFCFQKKKPVTTRIGLGNMIYLLVVIEFEFALKYSDIIALYFLY